jgi:RNA polymerase sigma-70 factor (ECF subfamily)
VAPALDDRFESVFRDHFAYVVHSLRLLGVHERDLDDVAQDVFVAVHQKFADYDASRPIKAWLFSFAARFASNYRRLARHRHEAQVDADSVADGSSDGTPFRQMQLSFLQGALGEMEEPQRIALIMHDIHGLTATEIAAALEVPLNTVYSRVRRARKALRRIAARDNDNGGPR